MSVVPEGLARMIGRTLQHYEILEKLGSGGMGEVFVALDSKLHRRVELEVLRRGMDGDPGRRDGNSVGRRKGVGS